MEKTINEINDEEQVARILFSPSHIYEGRVSPKAFKVTTQHPYRKLLVNKV